MSHEGYSILEPEEIQLFVQEFSQRFAPLGCIRLALVRDEINSLPLSSSVALLTEICQQFYSSSQLRAHR